MSDIVTDLVALGSLTLSLVRKTLPDNSSSWDSQSLREGMKGTQRASLNRQKQFEREEMAVLQRVTVNRSAIQIPCRWHSTMSDSDSSVPLRHSCGKRMVTDVCGTSTEMARQDRDSLAIRDEVQLFVAVQLFVTTAMKHSQLHPRWYW
jgi:hypothetical protein